MDPIDIGVDFHSRQQTICYLKTETGELVISELKHQDKEQVRAFDREFCGHRNKEARTVSADYADYADSARQLTMPFDRPWHSVNSSFLFA